MTLSLPQKNWKRVQRVTSKFYPEMIKGFEKKIEDVNESDEDARYLLGSNRLLVSFIILKDERKISRLNFS